MAEAQLFMAKPIIVDELNFSSMNGTNPKIFMFFESFLKSVLG